MSNGSRPTFQPSHQAKKFFPEKPKTVLSGAVSFADVSRRRLQRVASGGAFFNDISLCGRPAASSSAPAPPPRRAPTNTSNAPPGPPRQASAKMFWPGFGSKNKQASNVRRQKREENSEPIEEDQIEETDDSQSQSCFDDVEERSKT